MSTCKGCGREIRWIRMETGKAMPTDPEEIRFFVSGGPNTYITPDGKTLRGYEVTDPGYPLNLSMRRGYKPHWATCPAAAHFKNGGKKA